jgi:DNA topoisomerase-1
MVGVIKKRTYVRRDGKVLIPTELGFTVCDLLVAAFSDLFDYEFTALLEDQLDDIANGRAKRLATLRRFWDGLSTALGNAETNMPNVKLERQAPKPIGQACPQCGSDLVRRQGRKGPFVGCSGYPKCTYVQRTRPKPTGQTCPRCGDPLVERRGKHGPFLGCSAYPSCTYTAPLKSAKTQESVKPAKPNT